MRLIINLLSAQTIPNVQFIKEYYSKNDELFFVSTPQSQNQNIMNHILKSCNLEEISEIINFIIVDEMNMKDIKTKFAEIDYSKYQEILVNITGGTKIMSIATFGYFQDVPNSKIYYIPGKNSEYLEFLKDNNNSTHTLKHNLNIYEYLYAYGFSIKESTNLDFSKEYVESFYQWFMNNKTTSDQEILQQLQNKGRKKDCKINSIDGLEQLLIDVNFPTKSEKLSKKESQFLTGDWFEYYMYNIIVDIFGRDIDIRRGLHLSKKKKDKKIPNEFDIVFTYQNQLFTIECKTSLFSKTKKGLINDTIYKSASLQKKMGLFSNSFIFTLDPQNNINEAFFNRAEELNTQLCSYESISNKDKILKLLLNKK